MNKVYQQRKPKRLVQKATAWNTPKFPNETYYQQQTERRSKW